MKRIAIAAMIFVAITSPAFAKKKKISYEADTNCNIVFPCEGVTMAPRARKFIGFPFGGPVQTYTPSHSSGYGAKPRAWCGWYMRTRKGVSDPKYNLARNWMHYGSPAQPGVGVIVVWRHHVGEIVGRDERGWIVHSGNDGNRIRERVRSLAGAIAFRA